jgi:3-hydroxyisobutyrate dehydrogenase-like beta-hydroxyacid dehydrogenase
MEVQMANLGYVGLGVMGSRMVKRLMDAGHTVTGYNRTKSKADWLLEAGMLWADSPRAVAEAADVIFTMVSNTKALRAVADGPDGILAGLGPGKIYIEMSTIAPEACRELASQVAETGAKMVDAPVSGSVETLESGKLTIMVGGEPDVFEEIKPILLDVGPKATYVGENGLGVTMKIAHNLSLAVQMLAFSEGALLAEKSGIDREIAVEVLTHGVIASEMVKYRCPFILDMPREAWFNVNMMQKDMNLALELSREVDVPVPTTSVTNDFLTAARAMGLEKYDFAVIFNVLATMAGVEA